MPILTIEHRKQHWYNKPDNHQGDEKTWETRFTRSSKNKYQDEYPEDAFAGEKSSSMSH
jgi:hypothetical protein